QERMTFSVPKERLEAFLTLARRRNVEASVLGEFDDSGLFRVDFDGKTVALLRLDFLHEGLPPMILKAKWEGPTEETHWSRRPELPEVSDTEFGSRAFHELAL